MMSTLTLETCPVENIVYVELLRRGYKINTEKLEQYWVDFVCEKSGKYECIQVSYRLTGNIP